MAFVYGDEKLTLEIAGVQYSCDASSIVLEHEEDDRLPATFCKPVRTRGKFTISALTSTASGQFWRYLWANAGAKNIPFVYAPHGNEVATADEPHFTGEIDLPDTKPSIGGEAGKSAFTFETELLLSADVDVEMETA